MILSAPLIKELRDLRTASPAILLGIVRCAQKKAQVVTVIEWHA